MKMFLQGQWQERGTVAEVIHPYDGAVLDTSPWGLRRISPRPWMAWNRARRYARVAYSSSGEILRRTAQLMAEQQEDLARLISREEGRCWLRAASRLGARWRPSIYPPMPRVICMAKPCRWMPPLAASVSWDLPCACRAASWRRLRPSTFRSTSWRTKSGRPLPAATPCSSNPPAILRSRH